MTVLPHLAARLFGVPLAIHRPKLDVIVSVLGARIGVTDQRGENAWKGVYSIAAGIGLSFATPVLAFWLLRLVSRLGTVDAAAVAGLLLLGTLLVWSATEPDSTAIRPSAAGAACATAGAAAGSGSGATTGAGWRTRAIASCKAPSGSG